MSHLVVDGTVLPMLVLTLPWVVGGEGGGSRSAGGSI